ncbi:hypothetical protein E4U41_000085 [Claviceps citrina]|nr:hypothetical protein E4U41_000085 [Claviceps citrina]
MQGSKRKREGDGESPTNRSHHKDRFRHLAAQNGSQGCSQWSFRPSISTLETAQPSWGAFEPSYNDGVDDPFCGHGPHETAFRHNGTACHAHQSQQENSSANSGFDFSCPMPMHYPQAADPSIGEFAVTDDTTPSISRERESDQFYDPMIVDDRGILPAQSNLYQPDLETTSVVNRGRYQDLLPQRSSLGMSNGHSDVHPAALTLPPNFFEAAPGLPTPLEDAALFPAAIAEQSSMPPAPPYDAYQGGGSHSNSTALTPLEESANASAVFQSQLHEPTASHWKGFAEAPDQGGRPLSELDMGGGELCSHLPPSNAESDVLLPMGLDDDAAFPHDASSSAGANPWPAHKSLETPAVEPTTSSQNQGQGAAGEDAHRGAEPDPLHPDMACPSRKRGPFDVKKRKETAETRKRKACLRCRVQKIRCDVNENEIDGACVACLGFSKVSKKTLHHVSCYRGKLTDVTLYRKGGLNLTKRWTGTEMKDVGDRINSDRRIIEITLGICPPLSIKVVRFRAGEGDVVARYWTVREGERGDEIKKKKDLEPYCLVDIWATAAVFEKYIIENAIPTIIRVHTPHKLLEKTFLGNDVINKTYLMAVKYYYQLDIESGHQDEIYGPSGKITNPQKTLLGSLFVLWLANRHTTGSAYICGDDTLGMKPEVKDATYPLFGRVSMPRMLIAQFDSINHTKLLSKYGHKVLRDLETFILRNQSAYWWTIYLCIFILLHQASWVSADRYRHARNNYGGRYRYSIPSFVEELQEGCNNILIHWQYYNCHAWPDPDAPWERHKHFMAELTSEQHDLVMETLTDPRIQKQLAVWKRYKEQNGTIEKQNSSPTQPHESPYIGSQTQFDWDHPCYWIAQMFEERWHPHPTYQREFSG